MRTFVLALVAVASTVGCAAEEDTAKDNASTAASGIVGATLASAHPEACVVAFNGALCSGALIAPNVVLTAGHCVAGHSGWTVRCPYSHDTATVTASQATVAPNYPNLANPTSTTIDDSQGSDIGLIRLDRALAETRVGRVRLSNVGVGLNVYAMGRINNGTLTSNMYQSPVFTLNSSDTRNGYWVGVDHTVIQPGDSGGPLTDNSTGEIVAVNSAGSSSCTPGQVCDLWAVLGAASAWFNSTMASYTGTAPAPTPTPAPTADPCAANTTCASCTAAATCGWCHGACVTGTANGGGSCTSTAGTWAWTSGQCSAPAPAPTPTPAPTPAPTDACSSLTDCGSCTAAAGCGFCNGHCVSGNSSGGGTCTTAAGNWSWTGNQCPGADPCNAATDCASCTAQASCGWCNGQCFTGTGAGPSTGRCGGTPWDWYSSQCQ